MKQQSVATAAAAAAEAHAANGQRSSQRQSRRLKRTPPQHLVFKVSAKTIATVSIREGRSASQDVKMNGMIGVSSLVQ